MKTLQKQTSLFTEEQLTSSQEDSHANHTVQQEKDLGKKTSGISGRICSERFERLSQPSLWAKMFVASLIGMGEWSSKKCALTWKLVGTKYNRYYCQLVPSVRPIEEIEFGLLPTIIAQDGNMGTSEKVKERVANKQSALTITRMAAWNLLPTPMAQSRQTTKEQTEQRQMKYGGKTRAMYLENFAAMGWLPTPMASESTKAGKTSNQNSLTKLVKNNQLLPTPTCNDATNSNLPQSQINRNDSIVKRILLVNPTAGKTSHLNPQFVAEMMGFPTNWTELPFLIGEKNQSKDMETP